MRRLSFVVVSLVVLFGSVPLFAGDGLPKGKIATAVVPTAPGFEEQQLTLPQPLQPAPPVVPKTVQFSDGFEGSFPGGAWTPYHGSSNANVDWGRVTNRRSAGSASIWCAASGPDSPGVGNDVPNNMYTWAIAGPFDLSGASSGSFSFDLWMETESGYDFFKVAASLDGQNFTSFSTSDSTGGNWARIAQDITDWGGHGNLAGQPEVWFALIYETDGSITYEGAYVDQVVLETDAGGGGPSCGTYVLTDDNEDNATTGHADGDWHYCLYNDDPLHPIEFRFDVQETNVNAAQLLLLVHDVDQFTNPNLPEVDRVYFNGTYLGDLTGADDEDSTTIFTVPPSSFLVGRNWVEIQVNQHANAGPRDWCVELKQAQLIVNGGCSGQASCRSVSTDQASYGPGSTVRVTYEVDTSAASQQVRVETNLLNPSGVIVAGSDQVYTTSGSSNDPKTVSLTLPGTAASGTYTAQVLVFDNVSGALESSCEDTFTVTGGGGGCTLNCSASVPATAQVGVPVQFVGNATATGCNGTPEFFWYPDTSTTATVFQQSFEVTYDQPGTYNWQMVVIVDNERCERNGTITVTGGGGGCTLNCSASVPATAQVGVPVQFVGNATATGCNGTPEFFWYPDTSTTATVFQQSFEVTYDQPGTYNWQMVVIVDNERCERNGTITVTGGGGGTFVTWVPVGSRADGVNGSIWRTDLGLFNGGAVTITVQITIYLPTGGPITRTVTIAPFGTIVLVDVVGWLVPNAANVSGAIRVSATGTVIITSRTYNQFPAGVVCFPMGTLGQALDGMLVASMLSAGQSGWLPALIENPFFRSNIGYTNSGTTSARVRVELYGPTGALLGSYTENLAPGQWKQANRPYFSVAGQTNMAGGAARITVLSGSGVAVYGSVIDNITNDPTTILLRR